MILQHIRHLSRSKRTLWTFAVLITIISLVFGINLLLGNPEFAVQPSADDQIVGLGLILWSLATILLAYKLSKAALWMMGILAVLVLVTEIWGLIGLRLSTYGLARILVEQYLVPAAVVILPFELYRRALRHK